MNKPKIFIGSTKEGLKYAKALENLLFHEQVEAYTWVKLFREPLTSNIEELEKLKEFDFGVIIFTPDDIVISRNQENVTPRDNLIFELGLLIGYLGRNRVFPFKPMNVKMKLPSDLLGTNALPYKFEKSNELISDCENSLSYAVNNLVDQVNNIGQKQNVVGQPVKGMKSNILIHPKICFYTWNKKPNIAFKVAYNGEGKLIDVRFHTYLITTKKRIHNPDKFYNKFNTINLTTEFIPEVKVSWTSRHYLDLTSPILEYIKDNEIDYDKLKSNRIAISFYIQGKDSIEMTQRFQSFTFGPEDIIKGRFKDFAPVNQIGQIEFENIIWEDFEKLE